VKCRRGCHRRRDGCPSEWLKKISGARRKPPVMGNRKYPALMAAPGQYVHET
jgi:poly(3-hydroxyalkanoate) synthetase